MVGIGSGSRKSHGRSLVIVLPPPCGLMMITPLRASKQHSDTPKKARLRGGGTSPDYPEQKKQESPQSPQ